MTKIRKILGLAALVGVVGLADSSSAQAATKKKQDFSSLVLSPVTTSSNTIRALSTTTSARATLRETGITARATPFNARQFLILERQYERTFNALNRAELSQFRLLSREVTLGLITPTQYGSQFSAVVTLYSTAKVNLQQSFITAATAFA